MLLNALGHGFEVHQVDFELYRQAIALLQKYSLGGFVHETR